MRLHKVDKILELKEPVVAIIPYTFLAENFYI